VAGLSGAAKDAAMEPLSADAAAIALFRRQHGSARVSSLRALGLSKNQIDTRVKKGIYTRSDHGLVSLGTPGQDIWARTMRSVLIAGRHGVAAFWTAAQLHSLDAPRDKQIHVVVCGARPRRPTPDLYVHRTRYLPSEHVTTVNNVPVTSLARTIADCAQKLSIWEALRVLDSSGASPRMWQEINRTAERLSNGRPGVRAIADATAPDGAQRMRSALERRAREVLRLHGVPDGDWNVVISDERGPIREVDLCYAAARLVIEVDGLAFHRGPAAAQRDRAGDRRLVLAGWRVIRFTWRDLMEHPDAFGKQISDGFTVA
jgi:predicted transcriptional regulator of viral defense system